MDHVTTLAPLITNDAIVLGILILIIMFVFYTSNREYGFWKKFHQYVPPLFLCYLIPALCYYPLGLFSADTSKLYFVATRFLLPVSIIFLCVSADIKGLISLGSKSLIMFFTGAISVIIGGVASFLLAVHVFPSWINVEPDLLYRGLATICGSWIGGSANQTAMKEIYNVPDSIFASMLIIDVIGAYTSMAILLYWTNISHRFDKWVGADMTSLESIKEKMSNFSNHQFAGRLSTYQLVLLLSVGFITLGLSHLLTDLTLPIIKIHESWLAANRLTALNSDFFWIIFYATTLGICLSFTKAKKVEEYGASNWANIFIYILVATIGMKMNVGDIITKPGLLLLGITWLSIHFMIMVAVAYWIKAPFFYLAVASQANIGGAASAPVVAAAFHPSLAPVGVVMAVLGYAIGTYGAIVCAQIMASLV